MPSLCFCRCECGIRYKSLQAPGQSRRSYICECGQPIFFFGEILRLWWTRRKRLINESADWTEIAIEHVTDGT
jgi:hypothetical protein